MAASLEARVPYADHLLVEQAVGLPQKFKIDVAPRESAPWLGSLELAQRGSLRSKRVLRRIAKRMMPRGLAQRPKQSFPTPLSQWLNENWKSWVDHKLTHSAFAREIFQPNALVELKQLPDAMAMWKWPILNTILWGESIFE